jgi:hypothetical protein
MSRYDDLVIEVTNKLIKKDEDARKARGINKTRSEVETIKYRTDFDRLYNEFVDKVFTPFHINNTFPLPLGSDTFEKFDLLGMHPFLDDMLMLPDAISKVINYKTANGGRNTDLAKVLNLYALTMAVFEGLKKNPSFETQLALAFKDFINRTTQDSIMGAFFSERGMQVRIFIYWLIFDREKRELDLNLLLALADAAKGSFQSFKTALVPIWGLKQLNAETTKIYEIIEAVKNW